MDCLGSLKARGGRGDRLPVAGGAVSCKANGGSEMELLGKDRDREEEEKEDEEIRKKRRWEGCSFLLGAEEDR